MQIIKEADFRKRIKKGLEHGYLFFGEEDYLKAHAVTLLRRAVCREEDEDLCCTKIGFLTYTPERLLDIITSIPMYGERRLIELSDFDFGAMKKEDIASLCSVLSVLREYDYNTLVLSVPSGKLDEGILPNKPSEKFKLLAEQLLPVRFEHCTPSQLALWAGRHFTHNGVDAPPDICTRLISFCGRDMYTLAGEIDKISYYVLASGRKNVALSDIEAAAVPNGEFAAFDFANALTSGDRRRALSILALMEAQKIEPVFIMGEISRVFCDLMAVRALLDEGKSPQEMAQILRMHEYRVGIYASAVAGTKKSTLSEILRRCTDADIAIKSSFSGYTAIEKLICSI